MRIVEPTLNMFLGKLNDLDEVELAVMEASAEYLDRKKKYGGADSYTRNARAKLESELTEFKRILSEIYDFMHDRGLTNFESGIIPGPTFHPVPNFEPEPEDLPEHIWVPHLNHYLDPGGSIEHTSFVPRGNSGTTDSESQNQNGHREGVLDLRSTRTSPSVESGTKEGQPSRDQREEVQLDVYTEFDQEYLSSGG